MAAARKALHELVDRGHVDLWLPTFSTDWKTYVAADLARAHELIEEPVWGITYADIPPELLDSRQVPAWVDGTRWRTGSEVEEVRVSATDRGKSWVRHYGHFGSRITRIPRPAPEPELVDGRLPWRDLPSPG